MKLISLYTYLEDVGGANNLCVIFHNSLMRTGMFSGGKVSSFTSYEDLATSYKEQLGESSYMKFQAMELLKGADEIVFLSHHRKMTTILLGLSKLLRKKVCIVHIAHITLNSLKYATLFPKYTIAVSKNVKQNLQDYFNVKDVRVIYNGTPPVNYDLDKPFDPEHIVITMPALIDSRKQQVALLQFLKDKLAKQVTIQFAGDGPDREELEELVSDDNQFKVLGLVDDMHSLYRNSDYVLLFSKSEGLPLCLIEAQSYGIPIICNDVGGNLEILEPGENGFFVDSMPELLERLNNLPNVEASRYQEMRERSLENFTENFQFDKMMEQYVNLFQEVIQSRQ